MIPSPCIYLFSDLLIYLLLYLFIQTNLGIEMRLSESTSVVEERERCIEKKEALERINSEEQKWEKLIKNDNK